MKPETESVQKVTPFEVKVGAKQIDYDALIKDFGSTPISPQLLQRFQALTGQVPHPFLRRGLYFSHRDFDKILDLYEQKRPFYIFTGRGPSKGDMHIGHMVPFIFTAYLQRVFNCALVIQVNDDEKYFWNEMKLDQLGSLADGNLKEVLSFGFLPEKTFIFKNTDFISSMYKNICRIQKRVTFNQVKAIFGLTESSSIGKISFPAIQAAPSFSSTFEQHFSGRRMRCLILCAIDQDPYFRMTRDVAPRMKELKPALLHCKFIPGLQGVNSKMSASVPFSAIYLGDSSKAVRKKIGQSKSGGGETLELQRLHGANLSEDVPFAYLRFFLEDDAELDRIEEAYASGEMLTGEVKNILVKCIVKVLKTLQETKSNVTDKMVAEMKSVRALNI